MAPETAAPARDDAAQWRLEGVSETESLARAIAGLAQVRDVIGLAGALGTGKTTFARAFIRARAAAAGEDAGDVPSPTFALVQPYEFQSGAVWHFDLWRLDAAADSYELGIEEAFAHAISLIEWPEKIAPLLPRDRLDLTFSFADRDESRTVLIVGRGGWRDRLDALRTGGGAGHG